MPQEPLGKPEILTLHWSAGDYQTTFPDYHFCVTFDRRTGHAAVVQTKSILEKGAHTWKRNTGNIGLSFMAMADHYPVTDQQLEAMAKLVAELCLRLHLDFDGQVTKPEYTLSKGTLVPTGRTISVPVVTDHLFWAHADGYFPERVDIGTLLGKVKAKAAWYLVKLNAGAIKPDTPHIR